YTDLLISQTMLNEQMTQLKSMCEIFCQSVQKKREEKRIEEDRAAKAKYWKLSICYDDDDEDYTSAITPDEPVLSTEEPDNSLNQIEDFFESTKEFSSIDDDSLSIENIDYAEASPPDSELVSSEVMEIVIPGVGGIDDDILLPIDHDILPFHDDHVKEISSGSPTTPSDISLSEYDSF
nr:hypothetical protein [Tanacetum cinerariifolium]